MNKDADSESGFFVKNDRAGEYNPVMTDVEIIATSATNIFARGRRYGRLWMLKGVTPDLGCSTFYRQQLFKEFEIQSSLNHPAIASAVSMEEIPGLGLCIVMEWIEGLTLSRAIKDGLSKADRRRLALEIVEAVAYLHGQGVVHRDLKPSNIMVSHNGGKAVIVDFGLADTDAHTLLKHPAGTEGYVSPEQRSEARAEASNDVYSLGVILDELCPGMRHFARRCQLPADRRYADAGCLLADIKRRYTLKHRLMALAFAAILAAMIVAGALWIMGLHGRVQETVNSSELLRDSIGTLNEQMRDSINTLNCQLRSESALRQQEQKRRQAVEAAITRGSALVDSLFNAFTPRFRTTREFVAFANLFTEFGKAYEKTLADFEKNNTGELSEVDRRIVMSAVQQQYVTQYQEHVKNNPAWQFPTATNAK